MNRTQLEHVLRAVAQITGEPDVLVIGSQAILGGLTHDQLPAAATSSIEVDITFFDDPDDSKSDMVDGAIGELSAFHESHGYYAQGVSTTATLPTGWRDRVRVVESPDTAPGRGHCLDPHDCVLSKLLAGRDKDYAFAVALIEAGLIDPATLSDRVALVRDNAHPIAVGRVIAWLSHYSAL